MSEIILRTSVLEHDKTSILGFGIAAGIAGLVYTFIGLIIGDRAPSGMPESLPYVGPISLALLIFCAWRYRKIRGEIFITKGNGNKLGLTIVDAKRNKVIELYSPFRLKYGWEEINLGRGKRMYQLRVAFYDENERCLLSLDTSKHSIWGTPDGWKELPADQFGDLDHLYSCGLVSDIVRMIRQHQR